MIDRPPFAPHNVGENAASCKAMHRASAKASQKTPIERYGYYNGKKEQRPRQRFRRYFP